MVGSLPELCGKCFANVIDDRLAPLVEVPFGRTERAIAIVLTGELAVKYLNFHWGTCLVRNSRAWQVAVSRLSQRCTDCRHQTFYEESDIFILVIAVTKFSKIGPLSCPK